MNTKHTCANCGKLRKQYCYLSGKHYCSKKCYATLFAPCVVCKQKNMQCLVNLKHAHHPEQICDPCYNKKHGLVICTITLSFPPMRRR